ncbi:MAG: hypothetical protein QNJ40_08745 [Xanthomonadales bacterium]|nr:hypothetical protein [Xanthomonadales bacterium]
MKLLLITGLVVVLTACAQPTREELLEAEAARQAQCRKMLEEVEDAADRPLIRASLQENYNRQCLGVEYPDQQQ